MTNFRLILLDHITCEIGTKLCHMHCGVFLSVLLINQMWCDEAKWVRIRQYWYLDATSNTFEFPLYFIVLSSTKNGCISGAVSSFIFYGDTFVGFNPVTVRIKFCSWMLNLINRKLYSGLLLKEHYKLHSLSVTHYCCCESLLDDHAHYRARVAHPCLHALECPSAWCKNKTRPKNFYRDNRHRLTIEI